MAAALDAGGGGTAVVAPKPVATSTSILHPVLRAFLAALPKTTVTTAPAIKTIIATHPNTALATSVAPSLGGLGVGFSAGAPTAPAITPAAGTVLRQDYVNPNTGVPQALSLVPTAASLGIRPAPGTTLRQDYVNPNTGVPQALPLVQDPYSPHDPMTGVPIGPRPLDQTFPSGPASYSTPTPTTTGGHPTVTGSVPSGGGGGGGGFATPSHVPTGGGGFTAPPPIGSTIQSPVTPSAPLSQDMPWVNQAPMATAWQQEQLPQGFYRNAYGQIVGSGMMHGILPQINAGPGILNHVDYSPVLSGLSGYGATITPNGTPAVMSAWQRANLDPSSISGPHGYEDYAGQMAGWNPADLAQYTQRITGNLGETALPRNYAPIGIQPAPAGG